jgi:glycosyltransferase involved in cell wall biosynthesis
MKLSIIIPVFNEVATIEQLLDRVENADLGIAKEIIIIDDYSSDGTREILKKYEDKYRVIYHEKNSGKGRAIRTGLGRASGDWVVIQDADLEYEPADLKKLLEKMKEPGVAAVYGSRRLHHNYFKERHSGHIYSAGGIFLTWLANLLYGIKITDEPTCYKMVETELLRELDLQCERFEFCPEVTAKIAKKGITIQEVPINYYPRHKKEGKKIKFIDGIEAVWTLLKYRFKQ